MLKTHRRIAAAMTAAIDAFLSAAVITPVLAALAVSACASTDAFERARVLMDTDAVRVLVDTVGYADTVNFGGCKVVAGGDRLITLVSLDLFYDRNGNGSLDDAESIGHWSADNRSRPSGVVLVHAGNDSGFRNTGIPVQRLMYQATVTFADGTSASGTLRANER